MGRVRRRLGALCLLLAACAPGGGDDPVVVVNNKRTAAPASLQRYCAGFKALSKADLDAVHRHVDLPLAEFGLRLLTALDHEPQAGDPAARGAGGREAKGNVVASPLSAAAVFEMILAGARGQTATEMTAALGFKQPLSEDDWRALTAMTRSLACAPRGAGDAKLLTDNRLYMQNEFRLRDAFQLRLGRVFGATPTPLDFAADAAGAVRRVNSDVSDATAHNIEKIADAFTAGTKVVLVNAAYLKGRWAVPFPKNATRPSPFYVSKDKTVGVSMMHLTNDRLQYAENGEFRAVGLPFAGERLRLVVLLPQAASPSRTPRPQHGPPAAKGFAGGKVLALIRKLEPRPVQLSLPSFSLRTHADLIAPLKALGMQAVFTPAADLSGTHSDNRPLYVTQALQEAMLTVDEEGLEAAAATMASEVIGGAAVPTPPVVVFVDHPFLFAVEDVETGALLFTGVVRNPLHES